MTDGKTVKVGLGLYILNDRGQVLLGLRKAKHGEGTWCPPGGHMEYGESFEEGAVREAFEETGIALIPLTSAWRALPTTFSGNRASTM